ncbi:hypothetical protein BB560_002014 [Smittium megazygosporum]|uniref:Chitin-binding type-2 domain-containing protein n=1 Tax=Smittium megazygosporum TaxID=133381 RepID=A0A2T9ZFZ9_9FUNG|nr:hypothetical protein BB560_002014 [Smittium megazygosporum]
MKVLSIFSVLSFLAISQSSSIPDENMAKRQYVGSPCSPEGRTMCPKDYQHFYMHCVNGKWMQRDNPPGTKCVDDYANKRHLFQFD